MVFTSSIPLDYSKLNILDWLDIIAEPKNERTLIITSQFLNILEKSRYRSGKPSFRFLNVEERTIMLAFAMTPFDPFFEEFDEKIQKLLEAGVCPYRLNGDIIPIDGKNDLYDEEVPALVLSMDDLGIGFIVCLIPLTLSVFVFAIELAIPRIRILLKAFAGSIVAVAVIAAFLSGEPKMF